MNEGMNERTNEEKAMTLEREKGKNSHGECIINDTMNIKSERITDRGEFRTLSLR